MTDSGKCICIIMSCYNAAKTLPETLDSIAKQTYTNWRLIVVNDGSTDKSINILYSYKTLFPSKVTIIDQSNLGQVKAKNRAIAFSKEQLIAFLDADDVWHPNKLMQQIMYFNKHPHISLCYTNGEYIDENSKVTGAIGINEKLQGMCLSELMMGNAIVASSVMLKRSILDTVGDFDESLSACENWELWTRISSVAEIGFIDENLINYRRHSQSMSNNIEKMKKNRILVIKKNSIQYRNLLPNINDQTRKSFFRAYSFFGENSLWHLELAQARKNLLKALQYHPASIKCWWLIFKTCLGKRIIIFLRNQKTLYVR